jgi:hypothetical protein
MINRLFFLVVAALAYFNYAAAYADGYQGTPHCTGGFDQPRVCVADRAEHCEKSIERDE